MSLIRETAAYRRRLAEALAVADMELAEAAVNDDPLRLLRCERMVEAIETLYENAVEEAGAWHP